jgi:hypothetical protein
MAAYPSRFQAFTKTIRERLAVEPDGPGAWKRPAIIGGLVVTGLVALSVWLMSPNNPESVAGQEPAHYLIDNEAFNPPPSVERQQISLDGTVYTKSYLLNGICPSGSLTLGDRLHLEQYRLFTAVFGIPADASSTVAVDYAVIVDGVVRASGRVDLGQARRVTVPLENAREIVVRGTAAPAQPTDDCRTSALGIGNPGFS